MQETNDQGQTNDQVSDHTSLHETSQTAGADGADADRASVCAVLCGCDLCVSTPCGIPSTKKRISYAEAVDQSGHMSDSRVSTLVVGLTPFASSRPHRPFSVFSGITASEKSTPVTLSESRIVRDR